MGHSNDSPIVYKVRVHTPDHQLSLMLVRHCDQLLHDSDSLQTRLEHARKELISIDLFGHLLVPIEAEPEIEDVLRHDVHDDPLVVSDLVLQVHDSLILEVSLEHLTQLIDFALEGLMITEILIMPKLLLVSLSKLLGGRIAGPTGINRLAHRELRSIIRAKEEIPYLLVQTFNLLWNDETRFLSLDEGRA